ncbi:MAG: tyrosine-type recombinase/integrase [Acidobacteriota bacterium]
MKDFRGAWETAVQKIGLPDALFHDFRRTGVRDLTRSGVPEPVAMHISGHKTRSVFDRYNIVDESDVRAAGKAVEAYLKKSRAQIGHNLLEFDDAREELSGAK